MEHLTNDQKLVWLEAWYQHAKNEGIPGHYYGTYGSWHVDTSDADRVANKELKKILP